MPASPLRPAAMAFDAVAPMFDARFGEWRSVAAQRQAVRRALLADIAKERPCSRTRRRHRRGCALARPKRIRRHPHRCSPAMVEMARAKLAPFRFARRSHRGGRTRTRSPKIICRKSGAPFDGAFSNFAPLNCVDDLAPVARGLARLVKPWQRRNAGVVRYSRHPGRSWLRRCAAARARRYGVSGAAPLRRGWAGRHFTVRITAPRDCCAMRPWFRPVRRMGIGVFVPPSAAEPWISRHPAFLDTLEMLDRLAARPLAVLGDHILYHFERTEAAAP